MIKKYILTGIGMAVLLSSITAFAEPTESEQTTEEETYITQDMERDFSDTGETENAVPIKFIINVPKGFTQEVDIYFDSIPTIITYNKKATGNGYIFTKNVPAGNYHVTIGIPNDNGGFFEIDAPETFNTENGIFKVDIIATDTTDEDSDSEDDWEGDIITNPATIDYTNGSSVCATVNAKMYPCYSVEIAILTLEDQNGNQYKIPFNNQNDYETQVTLPVGTYKELTDIDVKLDDISDSNGATFEWAYDDDHAAEFGTETYVLKAGDYTDLRPYVIMMNLNDNRRVIDSTFLNNKAIQDKITEGRDKNRQDLKNTAGRYGEPSTDENNIDVNESYENMDGISISDGTGHSVVTQDSESTESKFNVDDTDETENELETASDDNTEPDVTETDDDDTRTDHSMIVLVVIGMFVLLGGIIFTIKTKKNRNN